MNASKYNTKEYWNQVFEKELKEGLRRIDYDSWDVIIKEIKNGMNILDIGCGTGEFLNYALQKADVNVAGIDHSEIALKATLNPNIATFLSLEDANLSKNQFDIITVLHTLEHFEKPIDLINKLIPYLKSNGLMIISLPLNDKPWKEHYQIWDLEDIIKLLNNFDCYYRIISRYTYIGNDGKVSYITKDIFKKEAIIFIKFGGK